MARWTGGSFTANPATEDERTNHIMKPSSTLPHLGIPVAHARDNNFYEVLDKNRVEYGPRPAQDICRFDSVIDIRDHSHRSMR